MASFAKLLWKGLEAINELIALGADVIAPRKKRSRYGGFKESRGVLNGEWVPVLSSWIDAARWEEETRTLWIRTLWRRKEYAWAKGISRELARSFFRVQSQGKFVWRHWPPRHLRLTAAAESARVRVGKRR